MHCLRNQAQESQNQADAFNFAAQLLETALEESEVSRSGPGDAAQPQGAEPPQAQAVEAKFPRLVRDPRTEGWPLMPDGPRGCWVPAKCSGCGSYQLSNFGKAQIEYLEHCTGLTKWVRCLVVRMDCCRCGDTSALVIELAERAP